MQLTTLKYALLCLSIKKCITRLILIITYAYAHLSTHAHIHTRMTSAASKSLLYFNVIVKIKNAIIIIAIIITFIIIITASDSSARCRLGPSHRIHAYEITLAYTDTHAHNSCVNAFTAFFQFLLLFLLRIRWHLAFAELCLSFSVGLASAPAFGR